MQTCRTFAGARTNGLSRQVDNRDLIGYLESKLGWDYLYEISALNSKTTEGMGPYFGEVVIKNVYSKLNLE